MREPYCFLDPEMAGAVMTCVEKDKKGKCIRFKPTPGAECIVESPRHPKIPARSLAKRRATPGSWLYLKDAAKHRLKRQGKPAGAAEVEREAVKEVMDAFPSREQAVEHLKIMTAKKGIYTAYGSVVYKPALKKAIEATPAVKTADLSDKERRVLQAIGGKATHIDEIARKTGLSPYHTSAALVMLELKNLVQQKAGKLFEPKVVKQAVGFTRLGGPILTCDEWQLVPYKVPGRTAAEIRKFKKRVVERAREMLAEAIGDKKIFASGSEVAKAGMAGKLEKIEFRWAYKDMITPEIRKSARFLEKVKKTASAEIARATVRESQQADLMVRCKAFKATCPSPGLKVIPDDRKRVTPVKPVKPKLEKPKEAWQMTRPEFKSMAVPMRFKEGATIESYSSHLTERQPERGIVLETKTPKPGAGPSDYLIRWEDGRETWTGARAVFRLGRWKASVAGRPHQYGKGDMHMEIVRDAIKANKKVPAAVRGQYPELAPKEEPPPKGRRPQDFREFWAYVPPKGRTPTTVFIEYPGYEAREAKRTRRGRMYKVYAYPPQEATDRVVDAMKKNRPTEKYGAAGLESRPDHDGVRFIYPREGDPIDSASRSREKIKQNQPWQATWAQYSQWEPAFSYDPDVFLQRYFDTEAKSKSGMGVFIQDVSSNRLYRADKKRKGKLEKSLGILRIGEVEVSWYQPLEDEEKQLRNAIAKGTAKVYEQPVTDFNKGTGKNAYIWSPAMQKPTADLHERTISSALRAGLQVPEKVWRQYPEMKKLAARKKEPGTIDQLAEAYKTGIEQAKTVDPADMPAEPILIMHGLAAALRVGGVKTDADELLRLWYMPILKPTGIKIGTLHDSLPQIAANLETALGMAAAPDVAQSIASDYKITELLADDPRVFGRGTPPTIRSRIQVEYSNLATRVPTMVDRYVKQTYNPRRGTKKYESLMDKHYDEIMEREVGYGFGRIRDDVLRFKDLLDSGALQTQHDQDAGRKADALIKAARHVKTLIPESQMADTAMALGDKISKKLNSNMAWLRSQEKKLETEVDRAEQSGKAVAHAVGTYSSDTKKLEAASVKVRTDANAEWHAALLEEFGTADVNKIPAGSDNLTYKSITNKLLKKWQPKIDVVEKAKEHHEQNRVDIIRATANKMQPGAGKAFYVKAQLSGMDGLTTHLLRSIVGFAAQYII